MKNSSEFDLKYIKYKKLYESVVRDAHRFWYADPKIQLMSLQKWLKFEKNS